MSRMAWLGLAASLAASLAACSIPDTVFHPSADGGGGGDNSIVLGSTAVSVPEGMTGTFDVSLKLDPVDTVTLTLMDTNPAALPIDRSSITFTGGPSGNWATPVSVKLSPPVDTNAVAETAMITVRGAGAPDAVVNASVSDPTMIASYGYPPVPAPFTSSVPIARGTVIAFKVPVPVTTTLDALGVYIPAGAGDFRMALYADASGAPGARLAFMPQRQAITAGSNVGNLLPDSADPTIPVGVYWVAIRVAQSTALGQSPSVTGSDCFTNVTIQDLDAAWPDPFGAHQCQSDYIVNLWMNTYHQ